MNASTIPNIPARAMLPGPSVSSSISWFPNLWFYTSVALVVGIMFYLGFRLFLVLGCILISRLTPIRAKILDDPSSPRNSPRIVLAFQITKWDSEINVTISIPFPNILTMTIGKSIQVDLEIVKLGYRKNFEKNHKSSKISRVIGSSTRRMIARIASFVPPMKLKEIAVTIRFPSPPAIDSPADKACGRAWKSFILISKTKINVKDGDLLVNIDQIVGDCQLIVPSSSDSLVVKFFDCSKLECKLPIFDEKSKIATIFLNYIFFKMDIEMFYSVFPTIAPLIELPFSTGVNGPQLWGRQKYPELTLPFPAELKVCDKFVFETSTKTTGHCRIEVPQITAHISRDVVATMTAEGCLVTRDSPMFGFGKIISIPSIKIFADIEDIKFEFPKATLNMIPDGFVYWLRALLMVGNKVSFVKRPYRVDIRNERVAAYYDKTLCGIEPISGWENLKQYYPRIVPIRIRLDFGSLDIQTERGERLISEDAFVDCNLPQMEISFNASGVEVFGASKKRCAIISSFAGWVPQFSSVVLKDVATDWMGKPPDHINCHHVDIDPLGPIPVNIRFADIDVEIADDLVMLLGQQVMEGVDSVRRWDVDPGYYLVPMYKTVTVRLSRVRFAPAELKPAVLHVDDWELAVGPTKDCLSFAFMGIKAWVPTTVTVPPILHVVDPVLVHLRVQRIMPVETPLLASDYASRPGGWRELKMSVPFIDGSVAPGLHATTRFIDRMMKTVRRSLTSVKPSLPPVNYKKGPIKNVAVEAKGLKIVIIRQSSSANANRDHAHRPFCTEDISESIGRNLCEEIGELTIGKLDISMKNFSTLVHANLESFSTRIPGIAQLESSAITSISSDGERYELAVSNSYPISFRITENAMAIFGAYSAIRESFSKAWVISQSAPKLQSLISHIVDVNASVNSMLIRTDSQKSNDSLRRSISSSPPPSSPPSRTTSVITAGTPLLNFDVVVKFPNGVHIEWSVPNMHAPLAIRIPKNNFKVACVFHGFALLGDDVVRRLPDLDDEILIQWLRYPWSLGGGTTGGSSPDSSPRSPTMSREKSSWDLHSVMTERISDFLASAGSKGCWEYASTRGPIDTPVYAQLIVQLSNMELSIGSNQRRVFGLDNLEFRTHCHNLPTTKNVGCSPSNSNNNSTLAPKLNVSFWTCLVQDAISKGLILDFLPDVHVPILLQLIGSPVDADPSVLSGFLDDDTAPPPTPPLSARTRSPESLIKNSPPSILEKFLDQIDLGFRITLLGLTGRAAGWTFASTKLCLFKEEENGKGIIVCDIREAQVAMISSSSLLDSTQPLHSRVCLGVPEWTGISSDHEVFPFLSVRQMMLHIGLQDTSSDDATAAANDVFCNIQGGRLWWSPSLNRAMRLSLERTDRTVDMITKWKTQFTKELFSRMGKSLSKKKTLESVMKFFDFLIPSSGQIKLFLRCADIQANMHNVLNGLGMDDLLNGGSGSSGTSGGGTSWEGSNSTPSKSPDIPRHFQPFRETLTPPPLQGPISRRTSPPVSRPQSPIAMRQIFCDCCQSSNMDRENLRKFLHKHPLDLALPQSISWWTRSGHMKGCPLPPVPLALYFCPPNSRRERAIGAIKYEQWLSEFVTKLNSGSSAAPNMMSPGPSPVAPPRPKPRGSQLLLSSREAVFEIDVIRTKSPSNIRIIFNAAFNALQGSVAPTALRGLVWLGQPGQNILRPILTIQRIAIVLSTDLFPLKTARIRLLIPKISVSADDDAFHLILDVFRNCLLYRGALIDPNPSYATSEKKKQQRSATTATATRNSVMASKGGGGGPITAAKREMIVESLLRSLAQSDANLPASADDLSAEYVVESVSLNLTHRQRCFIQLQLVDLVGKHAFSLSHPHRPMIFSVQVRDISILSGDALMGPGVTNSNSGTKTVLRSAGGHGNLITVRGNDRYVTLNNREWHIYDTLFLSMAPIVVDVTQELIEELYAFIFPPEEASGSSQEFAATGGGAGMRRLSSATQLLQTAKSTTVDQPPTDDQFIVPQEIVGNKLLTGRNRLRLSNGGGGGSSVSVGRTSPIPVSPKPSSENAKIPILPGTPKAQNQPPANNASSSTDAELVLFKFVRFSNIDLIITFKGKQFSLNNLSLTLKYYLKRRKLSTWKEFLDEWGSKVGKQAVGSFVKHGFTRKRGIQDLIVNKLNQFTSSEKEVEKILFGKFASSKQL